MDFPAQLSIPNNLATYLMTSSTPLWVIYAVMATGSSRTYFQFFKNAKRLSQLLQMHMFSFYFPLSPVFLLLCILFKRKTNSLGNFVRVIDVSHSKIIIIKTKHDFPVHRRLWHHVLCGAVADAAWHHRRVWSKNRRSARRSLLCCVCLPAEVCHGTRIALIKDGGFPLRLRLDSQIVIFPTLVSFQEERPICIHWHVFHKHPDLNKFMHAN